ncbi:MAG TPA: NADH-quinone oxidoreductase subunit L [Candidatus Xenobia bacterium]|nr:NADH-quinone oxidoreductase subunit L [Candidatus Xenobia bacterium]
MPQSFLEVVWLVPLLPAASAFLMLLIGRRLPRAAVSALCCGTVGASFLLALGIFSEVLKRGGQPHERTFFTWIPSLPLLTNTGAVTSFEVKWGFLVDPLSTVMILVVTGVGFLIHVYSTGYMAHEGGYYRFFGYLNLFMFMMLTLVLANNFLMMFVGWEGVGLCSYLLIGFWFLKKSATDAANKAFIVNRVGDAGFLIGMFLTATTFGTLNFLGVNRQLEGYALGDPTIVAITLLLFVGATGKSAQIPLYVWLPDAMEGPTPVSALIHAATMVTAGVYMVSRANGLYQLAPLSLEIVAAVGALTAIYAASMGLVQNDIKRVLAYSTISQLGYMFMACGVGAFAAGIFHLYTHAFFKALLFLGAGAVIHALGGEQDLGRMGGLRRALPLTYRTFLAGALALAGVPLLAGFFSKDEILVRVFAAGHPVLWTLGVATTLLTAVYTFRLVFLAFHGEPRAPAGAHPHDPPPSMAVPLVALAAGAVAAGYVGVPAALGGSNWIGQVLEPVFAGARGAPEAAHEVSHATELVLTVVSAAAALAGIALAHRLVLARPDLGAALAARVPRLAALLSRKYYVDEAYDAVVVRPIVRASERVLWRGVDAQVIDGAVHGLAAAVRGGGAALRRLQTGSVRAYAMSLLAGVLALIGYYLWRS